MNKPKATAKRPAPEEDARARIIVAAAALIARGGRDAATTRAVAAAAAVQAPTIYRLFGDKRGLLDAVAEYGLASYVAEKAQRKPLRDPVAELARGWDMHVAFGLAHPGLFTIMSGDPQAQPRTGAIATGLDVLAGRIRAIALAGRLTVSEPRALALLQSSCAGTVLHLLGQPPEQRDPGLSAAARTAVINAITGSSSVSAGAGLSAAAATLRASLTQTQDVSAAGGLSRGERHLLNELLDRIADGNDQAGQRPGRQRQG